MPRAGEVRRADDMAVRPAADDRGAGGSGDLDEAMAAFEAAIGDAARFDDSGAPAHFDEAGAFARFDEAGASARGNTARAPARDPRAPAPAPAAPAAPELVPLGRRTLAQIREELGECTRCKLHTTRRKIVFCVGADDTPLMFVV